MKLTILMAALAICVSTADVFAQSRRPVPEPAGKRVNQRPNAARPTPTPTPAAEETEDAKEEASAAADGEVISVETRLVTMPVRVIDRKGRFVGGLTKADFSVLDNGAAQEIEHFQNEAQPFTVALLLDMSYSTVFRIEEIQAAAIAFVDQLRADDRVIVISFDQNVNILCDATTDRKVIQKAIIQSKISTGTSLYEAVDISMNRLLRDIEGRKAIVLFTDGVDTTSAESSDSANLSDAMELDALIYPIRYDTFSDVQAMKDKPIVNEPANSKTTPPIAPTTETKGLPFPITGQVISHPDPKGTSAGDYELAERYLDSLAERTGGRVFMASTFGNLNDAFRTIASELREFYSIGYYPADEPKAGQTRRVKVLVNREKVAVKARGSYSVPELPTRK